MPKDNPPTITKTIITLISSLHEAAEKSRLTDPVKYATLKAYQEALIHRLVKRGAK